jgi:hypothetical protein
VFAALVKRRLRDFELECGGGDTKRIEPNNGRDSSKCVAMAIGHGGGGQRHRRATH